MRPVDFFIVGQPKSGTSALASFLAQHPEVCFSLPKEPGWMAHDLNEESVKHHGSDLLVSVKSQAEYEACFSSAEPGQLLGEGSTIYLHSQIAARSIAAHNPNARIIVMLRDPVDMVHALHMEYVNLTHESLTRFSEALAAEPRRAAGDVVPARAPIPSALQYSSRARVVPQIRRFWEALSSEAVGIWTMEDLRDRPEETYRQVLAHVGVSDIDFQPSFGRVHEAKHPRSPMLNNALRSNRLRGGVRKVVGPRAFKVLQQRVAEPLLLKKGAREPMEAALRATLRDRFRDDVRELSDLTGRDFAAEWGYR